MTLTLEEWNDLHGAEAEAEGWWLCESMGSDNGGYQIQRIDELEMFAEDPEAWAVIKTKAAAGSACHATALEFIKAWNPIEYLCIHGTISPECGHCGHAITLIDGVWTDGYLETVCQDAGAAHQPKDEPS